MTIISRLVSVVIALASVSAVTAVEEVLIDNLGGGYFSVMGGIDDIAEGPVERGVCEYGAYSIQHFVYGGTMVRSYWGVTLYPTSEPEYPAFMDFFIKFDSPVDLADVDFFKVISTHSQQESPLAYVMLFLENGVQLHFIPGYYNHHDEEVMSFGRQQTKIPVYQFIESPTRAPVPEMRVSEIRLGFSTYETNSILATSLSAGIIAKKPLSLEASLDWNFVASVPALVLESNRPIGPDELYRLEISDDLKNWAINSRLLRGTGSKATFTKVIPKGPWYRFSIFNYIDVDS